VRTNKEDRTNSGMRILSLLPSALVLGRPPAAVRYLGTCSAETLVTLVPVILKPHQGVPFAPPTTTLPQQPPPTASYTLHFVFLAQANVFL